MSVFVKEIFVQRNDGQLILLQRVNLADRSLLENELFLFRHYWGCFDAVLVCKPHGISLGFQLFCGFYSWHFTTKNYLHCTPANSVVLFILSPVTTAIIQWILYCCQSQRENDEYTTDYCYWRFQCCDIYHELIMIWSYVGMASRCFLV